MDIKKTILIALASLAIASQCYAASTQVGRYLTVSNKPQLYQRDPLQQTFALTFPGRITTVGSAIRYILTKTGYSVLPHKYRNKTVNVLLKQKLPLGDRHLGSTTVIEGLAALAGNSYQVLVDPEHRYISFILKPKYMSLYSTY